LSLPGGRGASSFAASAGFLVRCFGPRGRVGSLFLRCSFFRRSLFLRGGPSGALSGRSFAVSSWGALWGPVGGGLAAPFCCGAFSASCGLFRSFFLAFSLPGWFLFCVVFVFSFFPRGFVVPFSLSVFSLVFLCGSRRPSGAVAASVGSFCRRLAVGASRRPLSVVVGGRCSGVPALAARLLSPLSPASPFVAGRGPFRPPPPPGAGLSVAALWPSSSARSAFVGRSCALVAACAAGGGLWASFPSAAPPAALRCSGSWSSVGSGSWSSLALAAGSGCACLVFSPAGLPASLLGFASLGRGWFFRPAAPSAVQLSLFG